MEENLLMTLKGTKTVIKFANLNTAEDYGKVKS